MTVTIGLKSAKAKSHMESNGRIVRSYTETYLYQTDAGTRPTFADIGSDIGIAPGSPYIDDTNATAGEVEIEHMETRPPCCAALATYTWSTGNPVPNEDSTDPSTCFTLWSLRPRVQQEYITKDRSDNLIVNSAGTPYDGGIPTDTRTGSATAKLSVLDADFDYASVMRDSGKINSATYLGAAAGCLQVDIQADEKREGAWHWWDISYDFHYDPRGIQPRVLDQGFYRKGLAGFLSPITLGDIADPPTADSTKVPEPEPLDGSGDVVPITDRPGSCVFITVDHFDSMDFATLPGL